ncbi:hypothetical protein EJ05DRAFT_520684 [Pseudovirgaria hyperparasitica]|uniref:Histone H4 n=1 Tax=Pseudovirgaria hyperparasitica TaxID=470096 RepID=A0A6A6VXL0_9PEZI|nr:uncharacterized protein EJ05DRAFT_520684 [Pseudovirgaria hyperparasitica]KAF2754559.1 hypothetical protein EJ05DRAFT_520684 [Pseudovirgaria hyperparasitica]
MPEYLKNMQTQNCKKREIIDAAGSNEVARSRAAHADLAFTDVYPQLSSTKHSYLDSPEPETRARTDSLITDSESQTPRALQLEYAIDQASTSPLNAPQLARGVDIRNSSHAPRPQFSKAAHFNSRGTGLRNAGCAKRHRRRPVDAIQSCMNRPTIRRLARRGGVRRISGGVYAEIRLALRSRLTETIRRAVAIVDARQQKTVRANDIVYALRGMGTSLYGFGEGKSYRGYSYM